jgi:hypothetical protein
MLRELRALESPCLLAATLVVRRLAIALLPFVVARLLAPTGAAPEGSTTVALAVLAFQLLGFLQQLVDALHDLLL